MQPDQEQVCGGVDPVIRVSRRENVYRIGHQLIDEFLEFVLGRARPNTVRAYAKAERLLLRGAEGPSRSAAQGT